MSAGWNTIESDAGVFTFLVNTLGVKDVQFEELVALDEDYLRQLSPVYGVIFLFKYPAGDGDEGGRTTTHGPAAGDGSFDFQAAEELFFAAQTIRNACGTQALLSVLLNQNGRVQLGPALVEFAEFTSAFPSDLRGEALSNSALIRDAHNTFARSTPFVSEQTRAADDEDAEDVYHFIAYIPASNGQLYELDGLQPAPIAHGPCTFADFPEKVIPVLRRRIERYPSGEIRFNLMAAVQDLRVDLRAMGDVDGLEREEAKRRAWRWENGLRGGNLLGFIGEMIKGVTAAKLAAGDAAPEAGYDAWIRTAKEATKKRVEEARRVGEERKAAKG